MEPKFSIFIFAARTGNWFHVDLFRPVPPLDPDGFWAFSDPGSHSVRFRG